MWYELISALINEKISTKAAITNFVRLYSWISGGRKYTTDIFIGYTLLIVTIVYSTVLIKISQTFLQTTPFGKHHNSGCFCADECKWWLKQREMRESKLAWNLFAVKWGLSLLTMAAAGHDWNTCMQKLLHREIPLELEFNYGVDGFADALGQNCWFFRARFSVYINAPNIVWWKRGALYNQLVNNFTFDDVSRGNTQVFGAGCYIILELSICSYSRQKWSSS